MKKYALAWIVLQCLTLTLLSKDIEMPNGGFEEGLAGWNVDPADSGKSQVSAEAAHSGKLGLIVTDEDTVRGSGISSSRFPAAAGKKYELHFWARNISGSGMVIYIYFYNENQSKVLNDGIGNQAVFVVPSAQSEWEDFVFSAKAPENTTHVFIQLHSGNKSRVTAHLDDFSLLELEN